MVTRTCGATHSPSSTPVQGLNVSSDDESGDSESGKEAWPSLRVSTSPPLMKVLKMTPKEARVQNYHDAVSAMPYAMRVA